VQRRLVVRTDPLDGRDYVSIFGRDTLSAADERIVIPSFMHPLRKRVGPLFRRPIETAIVGLFFGVGIAWYGIRTLTDRP
jgi:hypothetical protein